MSKRFEFERFDLRACACDECDIGVTPQSEFDGEWVKARAAIDREAENADKIRRMSKTLAAIWGEITGEPITTVSGIEFEATLIARVRDLLARNEGEAAMQRACAALPDGFQIRACIESGAGWVELYGPDDGLIEYGDDTCGGMTARINTATDLAIKADAEFEDANREPT
jgi:hypothetical protein